MENISLIITCHNQQDYLDQLINTLINQKEIIFHGVQIIIVDSSENEYLSKQNKLTIEYYKIKNNGPSAARNFGLKYARGNWIQFCDADDIINPYIFNYIRTRKTGKKEVLLLDFSRVFDEEIIMYSSSHFNKTHSTNRKETNILEPLHFFSNFYPVHATIFSKLVFEHEVFDEDQWFIEDVKFLLQLFRHPEIEFKRVHSELLRSFHRDFRNGRSLSSSNNVLFWEGVCSNYVFAAVNLKLKFADSIRLFIHSISVFHSVDDALKPMVKNKCQIIFNWFPIISILMLNQRFYFITRSIYNSLKN